MFLGSLYTSPLGYVIFSVSTPVAARDSESNSLGEKGKETPQDEELSPGHFLHFFLFIVFAYHIYSFFIEV